jgi:hypothetical protein
MADTEFMYMGKKVVIREAHPDAVVSVDGREFHCHHHHGEEGGGLAMWMCDEAYFASPDLVQLARHFADYGYMFDSPGRVVVDDEGRVVDHTKERAAGENAPVKKAAAKKAPAKKAGGQRRGGGN